jgi:EAL domain-containing protein (putative c-di-GMP-specific phosphodiesterase class I)
LVTSIDRWVIAQAIDLAAAGHPVELNLSARSFSDPTLPYFIQQLLDRTGADPKLLVFELTETALLHNDRAATCFAERIHAMGGRLALDDFGTGYGAFTYLKHLPVDLLKIDIEFVRDAVREPASRSLIDAVVSLADAFGLATVTEGVEDEATLALLRDLGVDHAQGYHLARPAPLSDTLLDPTSVVDVGLTGGRAERSSARALPGRTDVEAGLGSDGWP